MTKLKILNEVFNKVFVITTPHFEERIQNMKERLSGCEYEFLREGIADTRKKIKSGEYALADLNSNRV